ncbi:hypothetical protein [Herpetosiphon sp.]|uniref:hypothetical protein n=1 Tax=Herpetosiphon sp. TaxID=71864 RepID=UPI0002DEE686|nr:hypothetical protein [Herpetosiphon sp.]
MNKQQYANIFSPANQQSWMPIDDQAHWTIKNPLNLLIVLPIVMLLLSIVMA